MTEITTKEVALNIPAVDTWPITHLRKCCKKNKIKGYTKMDREQLVQAVKKFIDSLLPTELDEDDE